MTTRNLSYLLSFLMLLGFAACSDDDNDVPDPDPDPDPASFVITYSGDIEAEIEGTAYFGETTDDATGEEIFAIHLHSEDMDGTTLWFGKKGDQPDPGNFNIGTMDLDGHEVDWPDNDFLSYGNMQYDIAPMYMYFSAGGSITLEESGSEKVIATFEMDAVGFSTDDPETELDIQISGSFHALPGEIPDPDPDPGLEDFTATLSGDVDAELSGQALFANVTDDDTGEDVFLINLSDNESSSNIWLGMEGDRPDADTYPIVEIDFEDFDPDVYPDGAFIGISFLDAEGTTIYIFSNEGNVTLDESTPNSVAGSFDFSATGFDITNPLDELDIQITGDFDARGGDIDIPGLQ